MAWEENSRICLHMQIIVILSRTGVNHMKKYNKPMIAVRYVDIQGICAGSQVQIGPGYANEDACSKGNTTQLSIRDVWEDK